MSLVRPILVSASIAALAVSPSLRGGIVPMGVVDHTLCCGPRGRGAGAAYDPTGMGLSVMSAETLGGTMPVATLATPVAAPAPVSAATTPAAPDATPVSTSSAAAAPAPSTPPAVAGGDFEKVDGGYLKVGFDRLAGFRFVPPPFDPATNPEATPPTGEEQIPEAIKSLNGQKALVTGFMLPVKMEEGLVTEFLLVKDPMMCCYGAVPNMNEWIVVKMDKGVKPLMDVPISFYGQLHVGAMFESGYMTGIYRLEGERMGAVQG